MDVLTNKSLLLVNKSLGQVAMEVHVLGNGHMEGGR